MQMKQIFFFLVLALPPARSKVSEIPETRTSSILKVFFHLTGHRRPPQKPVFFPVPPFGGVFRDGHTLPPLAETSLAQFF